jgi:hypothetical protein
MAHNQTLTSIARRLRPAPERFAAAAAVQDPSLLMQAQAARAPRREQPARRQRRPVDGELLDQVKVGILATALPAPALAVAALAPLRRHAATVRRIPATSPCAA